MTIDSELFRWAERRQRLIEQESRRARAEKETLMSLPDGQDDPESNARVHVWRRPDGRIFHDIVHARIEDDDGEANEKDPANS